MYNIYIYTVPVIIITPPEVVLRGGRLGQGLNYKPLAVSGDCTTSRNSGTSSNSSNSSSSSSSK